MFQSAKVKAWEWSRSVWMIWTFVPYLNFIAFLYVGLRARKTSWTIWGVFYSIPFLMLFTFVAPSFERSFWGGMFTSMLNFAIAAVFTLAGFIHAVFLRREYLVRRAVFEEVDARSAHDLRNELEMEYDVSTRNYVSRKKSHTPPKTVRSRLSWNTTSQRVVSKESDEWN